MKKVVLRKMCYLNKSFHSVDIMKSATYFHQRLGMQNVVAPTGHTADCNQMNIPHLTLNVNKACFCTTTGKLKLVRIFEVKRRLQRDRGQHITSCH